MINRIPNKFFLFFSILSFGLTSCQSKTQESVATPVANPAISEQRIQTQLLVNQRLDQLQNYLITGEKLITAQIKTPNGPGSAMDLFRKAIAQAKLEAAQEIINRLMVQGAYHFESPAISPGCRTFEYQVIMPDDATITELNLGLKTCNSEDFIYVMKAVFDTDSITVTINEGAITTILKNITAVEAPKN